MIKKLVSVLFIFLVVVFGVAFIFENINKSPTNLKIKYLETKHSEIVDYGDVPVFAENMRFNHNLISYSIDEGCGKDRRNDMIEAFNIFSRKVKVVSFYESENNADIKVGCSNEFIDIGMDLFAAGEGGPSRIINTSGFKVIEEGMITLYNVADCDYPIVALHELGHVFGFDHSRDPKNIMYNTSRCDQRMSEDMSNLIETLYSIEALPDVRIESVNGVVKGRYFDFNISILNEGLIGIEGIDLTIFADNEVVDVLDLGEIKVGYERTLRVENMRIPYTTKILEFVLDSKNKIKEINKENNRIKMII